MSMLETVVQLKTDRTQWRHRDVERFWSGWPDALSWPFRKTFWPATRLITMSELKFGWTDPDGTYHPGLNDAVALPGMANAWPYPIENRINMLATGIKTPVGIKVFGPDLEKLSEIAERASAAVRAVPGTISSYPERTTGGFYLDIDVRREDAARYGLTSGDIQDYVQIAIGGMNVTTTVEGLERYPLNIRFARDYRDDLPSLRELLISTPGGAQVPLGQVADLSIRPGAPMIRSEDGQRTAWVFVDIAGRDLGGYVAEAREVIARDVELPPGYRISFSGTFEMWERTLPLLVAAGAATLGVITLLLYMSSRSWFRVAVVMLAVPFSLIGALWFTYALDYNVSLATVIGLIALAGLDAETGMIMLLYLDNSVDRLAKAGRMTSRADLWHAVHDGAVMRIRPKAMTVAAAFVGLVPLLWAEGTGADTMRRIAAPMIGGLVVSFAMELLVYPVLFYIYQVFRQGLRT
jgi:Cu(I)/Ag(I) efflux system membrane protein CusA/SilA